MNQLRWTIWWVNLDPVIGSEQGNLRPFLITDVTQGIGIRYKKATFAVWKSS